MVQKNESEESILTPPNNIEEKQNRAQTNINVLIVIPIDKIVDVENNLLTIKGITLMINKVLRV